METQYVKGDCIFVKENRNIRQFQYLTENIECDVLVVGGGATGAIAGYYLSKNDISTVIIEKARIAHCSTSITTSLLQYELDDNAGQLVSCITEDEVVRAYRLGLYAIEEIEKFSKEHNDFKFKRVDSFLYTNKNIEVKEMLDEFNFRKQNGFEVEWVTAENNTFGFDMKAAVLSKNGGAVIDPYRFTHSLLNAACDNGLRVYENTEAVKINYYSDYAEVETVFGYKIKCKKIVVATGYNTRLFTDRNFGNKYTTFNIATKPIESLNSSLKQVVVRDNCDPYHYLRTTDDNRIIIGGEDISFQPDIENEELCNKSYEKLKQMLNNLFPSANAQIEYEYCGAFATTKDNLGFIGEDPDNNKLWYCFGYGANGILFAVLGGIFLTKLYLGEKDENMELFKVDRFDG